AQAAAPWHRLEPLEVRGVLGACEQLVAAGDIVDLEGATAGFVRAAERLDRGLHRCRLQLLLAPGQVSGAERRVAGEEERFNDLRRLHSSRVLAASRRRGGRSRAVRTGPIVAWPPGGVGRARGWPGGWRRRGADPGAPGAG